MGPLHSAHPFALTHDPKPTIVIVPDSWLPAAAYARFTAYLETHEYPVQIVNHPSIAISLPSLDGAAGANLSNASAASDAASLRRNVLDPLIERDGSDVVLLMHAYGSKPGLSAASGLHKATRFRNHLPGGVLGIIAVSPIVLRQNTRLEIGGTALPSWVRRDSPRPGLCVPESPRQRFAGDCDAAPAQEYVNQMRPMAVGVFESLQPSTALTEDDYDGCLGAVVTTQNQAYPQMLQEQSLANSGRRWTIHRMNCSHGAPFIDRCAELAEVIERMVEAFEQRLDERWMAESTTS